MSTELATREPSHDGLVMVIAPTEAEQRLRELQDFVRRTMVEGEDYGVIPGTKGTEGKPPKKTLFQPGAQKLAEIYGLAIKYEDERPPIERWDDDGAFFAYTKRAVLSRRSDGLFLGSGVGSCNSKEEKYAGRWVFERDVPGHLDFAKLRSKSGVGKNKKPYTMYRVPNSAIFDLVNTIEKMACKRALVHAVIAVTRSAGIFTQDLDDISREARGEIEDAEFEPVAVMDPGDHNGHRVREPEPAKPQPVAVDPAEQALADELERDAMIAMSKVGDLDGVDALLATIGDSGRPSNEKDAYQRAAARRIIELATTMETLTAGRVLAAKSGASPVWHAKTKSMYQAKKAQIAANAAPTTTAPTN